MNVLPPCMFVCHECVWCLRRPPQKGISDTTKLVWQMVLSLCTDRYWELNLGPLWEEQMLWSTIIIIIVCVCVCMPICVGMNMLRIGRCIQRPGKTSDALELEGQAVVCLLLWVLGRSGSTLNHRAISLSYFIFGKKTFHSLSWLETHYFAQADLQLTVCDPPASVGGIWVYCHAWLRKRLTDMVNTNGISKIMSQFKSRNRKKIWRGLSGIGKWREPQCVPLSRPVK